MDIQFKMDLQDLGETILKRVVKQILTEIEMSVLHREFDTNPNIPRALQRKIEISMELTKVMIEDANSENLNKDNLCEFLNILRFLQEIYKIEEQ